MTEDWIGEKARYEEEKRRKRAAWEEDRRKTLEAQEHARKRQALREHPMKRGEQHLDYTGEFPTTAELRVWQQEFLAGVAIEEEAQREQRLADVEDIGGNA